MAKAKKNNRCLLQGDCERKCTFEGCEIKCDYFSANLTLEVEKQAKEKGIIIPSIEESINWDEIPGDLDEEGDDLEEEEEEPVQTSGFDEDDTRDVAVTVSSSGVVQYLGGEHGYTAKIQDAMNRTRHEFMYIGMLLCEVEAYGYYTEGGFADIYEYCEVAFGFKRSSTNNFMRVYRKFGEAMGIQERFRSYSYSQLTEMCSMTDRQIAECNPGMSVQRLREIKKPIKSIDSSTLDAVISAPDLVQTSGRKIALVINNRWVVMPDEIYRAFWDAIPDSERPDLEYGSHEMTICENRE